MNDVRRAALKDIAIGAFALAAVWMVATSLGDTPWLEVHGPVVFSAIAVVPLRMFFKGVGELWIGRKWVGALRGGFEPREIEVDRRGGRGAVVDYRPD